MDRDVLLVMTGGVVTFAVSWVLHQLQLGGRRRRLRREIREELELVALLTEEHLLPRVRLQQRIRVLLDGYAPSPPVVKKWPARRQWVWYSTAFVVSLGVGVAVPWLLPEANLAAVVTAAGAVAVLANFVVQLWERRRDEELLIAEITPTIKRPDSDT